MDKTIQTHIGRIKAGKFQKSEIAALTKMVVSARFESENAERRDAILNMVSEHMPIFETVYIPPRGPYAQDGHHAEVRHFDKPAKITAEQTKMGREYLKRRYIKTNGAARKCAERELTPAQIEIVRNVSRFEFVGILTVLAQYDQGSIVQALPIYRTYNRKGEYFDYAPIHWGEPVISELNG